MSQQTAAFTTNGDQVKIVRISREKELERLPPPDTERWVTRRKAQVVAAVRSGLLTFNEACERYRLSEEEFHSWMNLLDRHRRPWSSRNAHAGVSSCRRSPSIRNSCC